MSKEKGFEYISRQKNLKENEIVLGLRESEKLIGQLYPVLVDEQGNVLDGQHRLKTNPDWRREVVKGVDSDRKRAMIRLHANWHRRKVYPEQVLAELAKITSWKGAAPYAAFLGCSIRTVQRYLPQQYKERQRIPKRQLSLSEQKEMPPHEVKRRTELLEEERKLSWDISPTFPIDPPSWCLRSERRSYNLMLMGIKAGHWNVQGKTEDEIVELLKTRILAERERTKETRIHNYLYGLSDEQVKAYMQKASPKTRLRVEPIAKRLLDHRKEYREREAKRKLFQTRLDDLYANVNRVIIELKDGTKLGIEPSQIPKPKFATQGNLIEQLLELHVSYALGFDKYGYPLDIETLQKGPMAFSRNGKKAVPMKSLR